MTTLSLVVCAHHARREEAEKLAADLGCPISMDDGSLGSNANHDRALRMAAEKEADWLLVLEDDALPIPDFRGQAAAALAAAPCPFVSLHHPYLGRPDPAEAERLERLDPCWVVLQGWNNTLVVAVRADWATRLLDEAAGIPAAEDDPHGMPVDHRWGLAAIHLGYWVAHSNPSLAEHADNESLIAGPRPYEGFARRAYRVGRREQWTDKTL